jgi:hypothetical protein
VPLFVGVWLAALLHAGIDLGDRHARADLIDPGVVAQASLGGAAKPRTAAASPLATMLANPNPFIVVPFSFCLYCVRAVARMSRFGRCVGRWWFFAPV